MATAINIGIGSYLAVPLSPYTSRAGRAGNLPASAPMQQLTRAHHNLTEPSIPPIPDRPTSATFVEESTELTIANSPQTFTIGQVVEWDLRPRNAVADSNSGTILGYNQASARYLIRLHPAGAPRWVPGSAPRRATVA